MSLLRHLKAAAPLALLLAGCGDETPEPAPAAGEALSIVEPGKEDNFLSASAQEYLLTGTTTVRIEAAFAGESLEIRLARARELVPYRQVVIGWFLNAYMVEKSDKDDNKDYGGFKALTKNGSWEELNLRETADPAVFEFDFQQEIAGPLNLLSVLPTTVNAEGQRVFELTIGKIDTATMLRLELNNEWYRSAPWGTFNPASVSADRLETVTLAIEAQPRPADAWFDYAKLVEDGVLDVGVHFGWDYHKEYHLLHSRAVYDDLIRKGFESPVGSYDELTRTSGPLKKQVLSPLGPVQIQVSLYWGKPGTDTDPDTDAGGINLEDDMRASLAERDVVVFSGHSGPFYGFALANWRKTSEGDLDDSELAGLDLPEKYQVVLAEGCDTYAIGQGFFLNPAKQGRDNIDIITTTSYSNASTANAVKDFLGAFVEADGEGVMRAERLDDLLRDLDNNSYWFSTMYGVHGIDDNPRLHPWGNLANLCGVCDRDSDCGGAGNKCVAMADGKRACTVECTADEACGAGFVCQPAQSGGWIRTNVCVSTEATCQVVAPEPAAVAEVVIDFVVPNPASDRNGDGELDVRDDEEVRLINRGEAPADLSGWSITDEVGVRYTFPAGTELFGGEGLSVFGGGDVDHAARLGLNNGGDTVTLIDARGAKITAVSWASAAPGAVIAGE
ncbi:MAG: lamin tail domain-containing protein [Myxococcales bacterium]|nr:lamin tail domain-containing protein [Myxococcales bacterium]